MKVSGPEDMHVIFYEKFGHIIDKSIYRMVRSFLQMDTYYWKAAKHIFQIPKNSHPDSVLLSDRLVYVMIFVKLNPSFLLIDYE